jgi:hypothetical protein
MSVGVIKNMNEKKDFLIKEEVKINKYIKQEQEQKTSKEAYV